MTALATSLVSLRTGGLGRSGATAVEFALVAGAFLTMMMLTVEVCYDMAVGAALDAGAHAASRFGITGATALPGATGGSGNTADSRLAAMQAIVIQNGGTLLSATNLQMAMSSFATFDNAMSATGGTTGPGSAGQVVSYTLTYNQPYLTPIAAVLMGSANLIHTSQMVVLNEPY